ncbi:PPR-2 multi-domain protein [Pyrenophora tritici-repentis]|nr:PPR-2 multi-domain protein [Pyrenophora tritici-repentis]KAI0573938.1 PPR-2 multi-domain protein [Pyrenophora tritici-repentis]KAI1571428.1 PPR-2 multi-domain protein [Pyrenophora tritici-repentis]KAI1599902.1 PPR-2 multi-domain protein [Pyrenophora tritici-repentis]PZC99255.1 PPR-2 multi-domain protein [Pyrenophora tritici-repentis]
MPRVRVPNASLIASADLISLPFLAPRVFVASRTASRNGSSDAVQKEEEKKAARIGKISISGRDDAQAVHQETRVPHYHRPRQESFAAGLSQMFSYQRNHVNAWSPVNCLYSDMFTWARQHVRSYATTPRHRSGATRSSQRRNVRAPEARSSAGLLRHRHMRASKRLEALALEQTRLHNYLRRLPSNVSVKARMKRGQYRSLTRRILNLRRWDSNKLDLTRASDALKGHLGLNATFAALDRTIYTTLRRHARRVVMKHDTRCVHLSLKLFPRGVPVGSHEVWKKWMEFDVGTRRFYARRLLIYLLDRKPGRALRFIQVMANDPLLRGQKTEAIADALGHLSNIHTKKLYLVNQGWGTDSSVHKRIFVPAFVHIYEQALAAQHEVCSQDLLYNLVGLAEIQDLKKVFDCLIRHNTAMFFDTVLHYASAFGEAGEVQYALRCLEEFKARRTTEVWESMVEELRLRWTCATILRKSTSTNHDFHQTPLVVATLVRLGIKMDILLYNIVMNNAMEAGDYTTAFKVFNTLETNGLKPDKHTYSILLHGCTLQSNPEMFRTFAQHCAGVAKEIKDPWLATDYLYYLYASHRADNNPERSSALLWHAYSELFSVAPLEVFANHGTNDLRDTIYSQNSSTPEYTLLTAPPVALYIMLQIEIESALAISDRRVLNLYEKFKSYVEVAHDPAFKALVKNPTIWNAFLLAFCQKQQFASASQAIRDMTDGPAKPNVYSWNIFMQAFSKTKQIQAAERVFEIMRSKGIEPDQYTYGILLRGYAKAQMVDPLATVVDRPQLVHTLEESRRHKEMRAQEKIEREAKGEHSRWQPPQFESSDVNAATVGEFQSTAPDMTSAKNHVLGSLPNESVIPEEPSSPPPITEATDSEELLQRSIRPTRFSTATKTNLRDPEVQYRKLQEQMGLIEPTESPVGFQSQEQSKLFGANLELKSMMEKARHRQQPEKPAVAKKAHRFNLAKPWKGDNPE